MSTYLYLSLGGKRVTDGNWLFLDSEAIEALREEYAPLETHDVYVNKTVPSLRNESFFNPSDTLESVESFEEVVGRVINSQLRYVSHVIIDTQTIEAFSAIYAAINAILKQGKVPCFSNGKNTIRGCDTLNAGIVNNLVDTKFSLGDYLTAFTLTQGSKGHRKFTKVLNKNATKTDLYKSNYAFDASGLDIRCTFDLNSVTRVNGGVLRDVIGGTIQSHRIYFLYLSLQDDIGFAYQPRERDFSYMNSKRDERGVSHHVYELHIRDSYIDFDNEELRQKVFKDSYGLKVKLVITISDSNAVKVVGDVCRIDEEYGDSTEIKLNAVMLMLNVDGNAHTTHGDETNYIQKLIRTIMDERTKEHLDTGIEPSKVIAIPEFLLWEQSDETKYIITTQLVRMGFGVMVL